MSACLVGSLSGIRIEHMLSTDICNLIGSGVLIAVGIWTIIQDLYNRHRPRLQVETQLGFHEWMLVGLAQTLTDLSVGVGLGFSSINIWLTVVLLGLFSFLFLFIPSKFFPKRTHGLGNHAAIFSGALLIIVGCIL
ncbi:manganese efflux pump [Alicyclobacillus fastidiosus]|uniref:manganese efflux pump n=1 Tax=Alicyclobacillus fastidiosus TaxID=392011 RepID=UPI0034DD4D0A